MDIEDERIRDTGTNRDSSATRHSIDSVIGSGNHGTASGREG